MRICNTRKILVYRLIIQVERDNIGFKVAEVYILQLSYYWLIFSVSRYALAQRAHGHTGTKTNINIMNFLPFYYHIKCLTISSTTIIKRVARI